MFSKKTEKFKKWIRGSFVPEKADASFRLIADLELAARVAVHDFDTMGEVDPKSMHALIRASKNLEREYSEN